MNMIENVKTRLLRRPPAIVPIDDGKTGLVCHCRKVEYGTVRQAIVKGSRTVADIQRSTTACTRCFGCRSEVERMLRLHLGDSFKHVPTVSLPKEFARNAPTRPMYMPVLAGFRGAEVDTRVIVFNWEGPEKPVSFRADLMTLAGERVQVWNQEVGYGCSGVIDLSREAIGAVLPDGVGLIKLILDIDEVGSLRPYFHFYTPTCVSSTHEKKGPADPNRRNDRKYNWIFPIGVGPRDEEAYFFCTNTQMEPMNGEVIWQSEQSGEAAAPVPTLEFDQSACVALHEHFPAIATGAEGGAVRLSPATHAVAGFMIRHDPKGQLWRVQHL
jgi:bacterioferritin-associated ferredoxin